MVHVHFRRSSHALTLGELPLVVGLLFCAPGEVMIAWLAGAALVLVFTPGRVPVRVAFNLAQLAVTAGIARAVFHAVGGEQPVLGPQVWLAAAVAVLLAVVASVLLVNAAMWLSGDRIEPRKLASIVVMSTCVAVINTSVGLALATVVQTDIRAVVLLLAPVLAVFLAYRAHLAERRQTTNLAFLHEASRALASASGAAAGVAGLLTLALDNFRGEVAEVCLFAADGEGEASRISVGGPQGLEVMAPLDAHVARELRELMDRDSAARLVTPERRGRRARRPSAGARRPERDARPAARHAPDGRDHHARRSLRSRRHLRAVGDHALRHARPPDGRRARPGPHDHQGRRAQGAAGRARAPGLPRPAHRARQPPAVHEPRGLRPQAPHRQRGRDLHRPRQLQADQRHLRPRGRRRRAEGSGRAPARLAAPVRHRGTARRRRVRGAAGRHPRGAHQRRRRPYRRQPHAAARGRRPHARGGRQPRRRLRRLRARSTPTRSCATPTSPCTSPSTAARAGSACSSGPSPPYLSPPRTSRRGRRAGRARRARCSSAPTRGRGSRARARRSRGGCSCRGRARR